MRNRTLSGALLLIGALVPLTSCNNSPGLTSIVVSPSVMNFGGPGLTTQLTAMGYYTHANHPPIVRDITNQVNWASSTTQCVTVSTTGVITSGQNICSGILITASSPGFNGLISATMTVNVTQPGASNTDVAQVFVTPANPAPLAVGSIDQFAANGVTIAGTQATLTNPVSWSSSNTGVATVDQGGRVTGVAAGATIITASYTNADGTSAIPGTATLSVQ
jgi:hypothetical protein